MVNFIACNVKLRRHLTILLICVQQGGTKGAEYDNILNHSELDYIFAVNKELECWLIPIDAIIESGNTKSFQLRTTLAPTAHPKLDTTLYRVRVQVPL